MTMKQLNYVLVLANTGSFSKAADILNISQPSLSQYVKKIESQHGIQLFDRTNGTVRLTDAGKVYIDAGRRILDLEHQLESQLLDIAENRSGSVLVGISPYRSAGMIPVIAKEFKKRYPGMYLVADERETQELKEAAERGEFDICITVFPVDEKMFEYVTIMEEEVIIAVPAGSDLERKLSAYSVAMEGRKYKAVNAELLNEEPFVMVTESQVMQKILIEVSEKYELSLKKAAVVKSLEAQILMVREGLGAAFVPTGIEKFGGTDGKIAYFSLIQNLPRRKIIAMYRREKYLSEPAKELIEIMKKTEW